ncbi:MAG: YkgJ family cysteine cluster protein [Beijerinckiaceae bacterium]
MRACGSCSLCCKLEPVETLSKAAGKWCRFCKPGAGACSTYALRPKQCRDFSCLWQMDERLGAEWKPDVAKFYLTHEYDSRCLTVNIDAAQPNAWKREPYYSILKTLAVEQMSAGKVIMIVDDKRRWLMMTDDEPLLGARHERFDWTITQSQHNGQPHFDVSITRLGNTRAA